MNWIQGELDFTPINDRFSQAAQVWKPRTVYSVVACGSYEEIALERDDSAYCIWFQYTSQDWRVLAHVGAFDPEYEQALDAARHYVRLLRAESIVYHALVEKMPYQDALTLIHHWKRHTDKLPTPRRVIELWQTHAPSIAETGDLPHGIRDLFDLFREIATWAYDALYPGKGWVYLIPEPVKGTYKIGKAADPDDRISTFEVRLPFEVNPEHLIRCTDRHKLESALHRHYASKRVAGEWFALTPGDVESLKTIAYVDDIPAAIGQLSKQW